MEAQFGRALHASPLASAFETSAASARPLLQAPHNVRLEGALSRSLEGVHVLSLSSVGCWYPFVMAENIAGAAFFFDAARGSLPEILVVENAVNNSSSRDLRSYRLNKTGTEVPDKV